MYRKTGRGKTRKKKGGIERREEMRRMKTESDSTGCFI